MSGWDIALFQWMAAGYNPDPGLLSLSRFIVTTGAWISAALIFWTFWRCPRERSFVIATAVACAIAAWLAHLIAASLNLQRPFALGLSPAYIPHAFRASFPSAHASAMFTAALLFLLRPSLRDVGAVLAFVATCMGWARIYAGIHFPMDIAAGLLLASMFSLAIHALWVLYRAEPSSTLPALQGNGPSQQRT